MSLNKEKEFNRLYGKYMKVCKTSLEKEMIRVWAVYHYDHNDSLCYGTGERSNECFARLVIFERESGIHQILERVKE